MYDESLQNGTSRSVFPIPEHDEGECVTHATLSGKIRKNPVNNPIDLRGFFGKLESPSRGAAETADDIPTFHADVPRILSKFRQGLYGCQVVSTWLRDVSADRKGPAVEVHFGVIHVKCVDVKLIQGCEVTRLNVGAR